MKKKLRYKQHFIKSWESEPEFMKWLQEKNNCAFCKCCNSSLNISAGRHDLIKHMDTTKHIKNMKAVQIQSNTSKYFKNIANLKKNARLAELHLTAFCVEHNIPFRTMDHLPQLLQKIFPDSLIVKEVSCGRDKTIAITRNVIGAYQFEHLCENMKKQCFSLCIDESTDVANAKLLSIVVRTKLNNKISDMFLSLIKIEQANAESIYAVIQKLFVDNGINYKNNLIGLAADGASVMTGTKNSVAALLKKDCPDIKIFKCICHSFNLCSSYAAEKLPSSTEMLLRNIYNYLGNSPKRSGLFFQIQTLLDYKPYKMLQPAQTRWLSLEMVVNRVIERYECIKIFFNFQVNNDKIENAKHILEKLNDPLNELFLNFLTFTLAMINNLNKLFQNESPQIFKLYSEMKKLLKTILECFLKPSYLDSIDVQNVQYRNPEKFLPLNDIYCGAGVCILLQKFKLTNEQKNTFFVSCLNYYIELVNQIFHRFDFNNDFLQACELIDPKVVISRKFASISNLGKHFNYFHTTKHLQSLDYEWRELSNCDFKSIFKDIASSSCPNVENFWNEVFSLRRGDGEIAYPLLKLLVQLILTLPNSSANVERTFSQINLNKTKIRNKLNPETLSGILLTKGYMSANSYICISMQAVPSFFEKFNSQMYKSSLTNDETNIENI